MSVTDALGGSSPRRSMIADGRTVASVNANGFATTQVYDAVGQRVAIIDAQGKSHELHVGR